MCGRSGMRLAPLPGSAGNLRPVGTRNLYAQRTARCAPAFPGIPRRTEKNRRPGPCLHVGVMPRVRSPVRAEHTAPAPSGPSRSGLPCRAILPGAAALPSHPRARRPLPRRPQKPKTRNSKSETRNKLQSPKKAKKKQHPFSLFHLAAQRKAGWALPLLFGLFSGVVQTWATRLNQPVARSQWSVASCPAWDAAHKPR